MSGTYEQVNAGAPGGINESAQAVRGGLAQAQSAVSVTQLETRQFLTEYGGAVVGGHDPVNAPGRQGDPDVEGRDAADG